MLLTFFCYDHKTTAQEATYFNPSLFQGLEWRCVGPYRGGRSNAVAGVPGNPLLYFMGSTGGGLWKTEDAGLNWTNVSDGFFQSGSVGAIAVAPSDPNIIFVGMGEHAVRGVMTSHGDGIYKSEDGGKTWKHMGLPHSRHIAGIQIHPKDPDWVYVAVQGALYGPSIERGVYRSRDGGINWERILYVNPTTGASDVSMDIHNPRILYAGLWDHQRKPWKIRSGGPGSGIYKSTDGGDNWEKLTQGLPNIMGKTAVAVSPANPEVVYAVLEADRGGVFRSDNGGKSWRQTNSERVTIARAWYYIELVPDPQNEHHLYVLNAPLLRSIDGGKTFEPVANPHSDQHDLWINPGNPDNMILANDGGACVTFNGGASWSTQGNQPTAQFYRLNADRQFPYHIYGGQQDNTAIGLPTRTHSAGITAQDWYTTAGGESAFLAFDPDDPRFVFGNDIQGFMSVFDRSTGLIKPVMAYPSINLGTAPREMKYRFNWNSPLVSDPFAPQTLYHGAQVVLRSTDQGQHWEAISPDLTRNDSSRQGPGGGPFTNEGAGGENYNTISYLACSPLEQSVIWVGSDDGLLHLSRDGGKTWKDISPPGLPEALINAIEPSPHREGAAYVVATRYKFDDLQPMVYYTPDYGQSWTRLDGDLPKDNFARVVREDKKQPGLLYAGTEGGLYLSFDRGKNWHAFRANLPVVPVTDLFCTDHDLVAATAGRSFWVLDDLSPLRTLAREGQPREAHLFPSAPQVRFWANLPKDPPEGIGQNPPNGFPISYFLPESLDSQELLLEIVDEAGTLVRRYSNLRDTSFTTYPGGPPEPSYLPARKGLNRFWWDLRRMTLPDIEGVFTLGDYRGSHVSPGRYTARLILGEDTLREDLVLKPHPKLPASRADYTEQADHLEAVEATAREIANTLNGMRTVKNRLSGLQEQLAQYPKEKELDSRAQLLCEKLEGWEKSLIQTRQATFQDVINYPNRLLAELLWLKGQSDTIDPRITAGARERLADLKSEWESAKRSLQPILDELGAFNAAYKARELPAVMIPQDSISRFGP